MGLIHTSIIIVIAAFLALAWSQDCRYEFIVPEGNGLSCSSPDVGKINSELNTARERANSVASTLGAEISKLHTMSAEVQDQMKTISQELLTMKRDVGKMNNANEEMEQLEQALSRMNDTFGSDFKYLTKKVMDVTASLQMQLTRQMDLISALAAEESSQRLVLDKQTITLNEIADVPQLAKGIQNEVNYVKSRLEGINGEISVTKHDLQVVKEAGQKSEEMINSQISNLNMKMDGLQSILLGVDLKAMQNDIALLKGKLNSLDNTLANHSKLLEGFNPSQLHIKMAGFEEALGSQREMLSDLKNKTENSSPAVISKELSTLTASVDKDREATSNMWNGLWSRLNSLSKMVDNLSREVAQLKTK
ncbi:uncharacterized protein LOC133178133 [Saccostrea echinata]|uniref:uncharacterized protein LOC133178133 n=1 Tax=Saccostrea echinata TaxID=191078 RepID=UPI002A838F06|nr:uncharacterized protein LOC133178133 [Saccostrea echinata]